jgi:hypothetical protein
MKTVQDFALLNFSSKIIMGAHGNEKSFPDRLRRRVRGGTSDADCGTQCAQA